MKSLVSTSSIKNVWGNLYDDVKEYEDDFKIIIRQREQDRIVFLHQSPQIEYRKIMVNYLKKLSAIKSLSQSCLHLAVYLMDVFMDNHNIIPGRLLLVANICLLLAAKLEENSTKIPRIAELNSLIGENGNNEKYSKSDYEKLEILVLNFFHFYIKFPTPAHYVFHFMQEFISEDDLTTERNFRTLFYDLHEVMGGYLDKIIDDVHYMQCYRPTELAAATIAASRKKVGLTCWTEQLERITDYTEEDLKELIDCLFNVNRLICFKCNNSN